jgi:predicted MFS family arabinose efflux permease
MLFLFDKNKNFNILLAGIVSIIVGVGVARFAFTSLLPPMLEDFLSVTNTGLFASINYSGYLSGALFSIFLKDINAKVFYLRIGIILSVITTFILAVTTDETLWFISRFIAGFGSAMVLIVGGAIVMVKLQMKDKTKAMGIHFSGIGFAIAVCELISLGVEETIGWKNTWMFFTFLAFILSFYVLYILSFDKKLKKDAPKHKLDRSIFTPYILLLILAYFTAGVGFVIQATFLPDIINSLEGLNGYGSFGWLIVGLIGVPSAIIWMTLAHKYGSVDIIIITFILQIIGILIPALSDNLYLNLFASGLYGSTFIGQVALFMHYGGKLAGKNPVVFMGSMTVAYSIGQIIAPLYYIALYESYGNYDKGMFLTAFIVSFGIVALLLAKKINHKTL